MARFDEASTLRAAAKEAASLPLAGAEKSRSEPLPAWDSTAFRGVLNAAETAAEGAASEKQRRRQTGRT